MNDLGIVIVTYNSDAQLLDQCVNSVLNQQDEVTIDIDLLVVDNASSDTAHLDLLRHLDVSVSVRERNLGFGAAVNHAIRRTDARWVLLLNPDAYLKPGSLAAIEQTVQRGGDQAIFAGLLTTPDGVQSDAYWLWWTSWQHFRGRGRIDVTGLKYGSGTIPVGKACGGALLASRALLKRLGPFDESFFLYGEDADLSLRALQSSVSLYLVPEIEVGHAAASSMRKSASLVEAARADSTIRLAVKHRSYPFSLLVRLDLLLSTLVGLPLSRSSKSWRSRMSRLWSVRRWGLKRTIDPFNPDEWLFSQAEGK